ncbi:metal ABC transporter ATP-binding protein [Clostridium oceanicum]|uniref:Metal ABC transporter ATP-binding protein n=1 Tax=Clostridium oceanicum TaxID=1543 RepID=A0ABP3UQ25_9CLOT
MLHTNNLKFSYTSKAPYILDNINLNIKKGDYVSILGSNGSGKSTLIKLILGFLKPTSGTLKLNTNKVGYVPQKVDNFNSQFPITVKELLNCHRKILKIKDANCINNSLKEVSMLKYKNSLIGNLSGGQRQKIFIAKAIMGLPDVLILDEPSTGIDIKSQKQIYKIIKQLNTNHNITILSVEHNIEAALSNSTYIFNVKESMGNLYTKDEYINMLKKEVI